MDDFGGIEEPYWSDLCHWRMIPTDGAHCCDRSSKVQDLNSTATVDNWVIQFSTCESQLELYKRIDNSLVFLAKNWKSLYFRSSKVCDSTPCFQFRFWRWSSDLSETISCQWSLEVYRTATKAWHWKFQIQKTLFRASTFSTPALRGSRHSSQHQQLRRGALSRKYTPIVHWILTVLKSILPC